MPRSRRHHGHTLTTNQRAIGGEPRLHVMVDPPDSLRVQRAIERLAAPVAGCVVVTPTPGTMSVGLLLQDVVRAAGESIPADWGPLTRGMVSATIDLLRHASVRDLYVLRAHRLAPEGWSQLIHIAGRLPLRLWLVIHQERPSRAQLRALDGCPVCWHLPEPRQHLFPVPALTGSLRLIQ
jgi:hypothetical protein